MSGGRDTRAGDARFEDGAERPLALIARDAEDLAVMTALVQDAVLTRADMRWEPRRRRFSMLLNRFRWEDRTRAERAGRPYERVRAVLVVEDVQAAAVQGLDLTDRDRVLSLLTMSFTPGDDGAGRLVLVFAGDGAVALEVECIELALRDVTRPYAAPARQAPRHPDQG